MEKSKVVLFKVLLFIGCAIFFYPQVSDYINNFTQSRAILQHGEALSHFDGVKIEQIKKEAVAYNQRIYNEGDAILKPGLIEGYMDELNPFNDSMMGSVEIEKINVNLPIYHGSGEGVIQTGVGHLEGTSLPIGGINTHSVITTHSGLPSAKLFTDLNKLELDDEFIISVLGEQLFYKVDQIVTVLPDEIEELKIIEGKDYLTMFTCTPYGINTHRLLIRGERIEKSSNEQKLSPKQSSKKHMKINLIKFVAIIMILIIIFIDIIKELKDFVVQKHE